MILYFSATGNTRFLATELARLLGDEIQDLCPRIRAHDLEPLHSKTPFVFLAPTYVCEPPRFFTDYLRKVGLEGTHDVYFVSVSGGYSGVSGALVGRIIQAKGLSFRGFAEVVMPQNYLAGKRHKDHVDQEVEALIARARDEVTHIADAIRERENLPSRHTWLLETLIEVPLNPVLSWMGHRVRGFRATDACIGCGMCARGCPVCAIEMEDGRPRWHGHTCAHCMYCIQNCPVEAIEYRTVTEGRRRYRADSYLHE